MLTENPDVTSYLMTIVMFALTVTIFYIFSIEMCMSLTSTFTIGQSQIKIYAYVASNLIAIVMFTLSVTVYENIHSSNDHYLDHDL